MYLFLNRIIAKCCAMLLLFTLVFSKLEAQQCDREALTVKYWQYRQNFNKHFIAIDRDPSGCVHDGIGQDPNNPCICTKAGLSLPATAIQEVQNGSHAIGGDDNRNNSVGQWYDPDCTHTNSTSSNGTHCCGDDANAKHNGLEIGSETPHQMGWYWVTLATEFALLKQNGQNAEAQRTLEELFLGLQAYKRLDIQANCLAKERYDEIAQGFETDEQCQAFISSGSTPPLPINHNPSHVLLPCLCESRYQSPNHEVFGVGCFGSNCFQPRTDGLSGFFVREDATQGLEDLLHDPTDDKYNVDVVNSTFALSDHNFCTTQFSRPCYLVAHQDFMSQDQLYPLILGLAFVKRYIPEDATVQTCEGQTFNIVNLAKQIAAALTDGLDNNGDKAVWPGSSNCCFHPVALSMS